MREINIKLPEISLDSNSLQEYWALLTKGNINRLTKQGDLKSIPEFKEYYQERLATYIETFETDRVNTLLALRSRSLAVAKLVAGILLLNILVLLFAAKKNADPVAFFSFLGFLALLWWTFKPIFDYKGYLKSFIFPIIFKYFDSSFTFSPKPPVTIESLKPSLIIPSYDWEETEDYAKGQYQGVAIELFEAELRTRKKRGIFENSETRRNAKFDGVFIRLSMNKTFSSRTIVKKDYGSVGNWFVDRFQHLEPVKLEDPVFEREFEVYSDDQTEARYILTTTFMEQLLKLKSLFNGNTVQCSFYNNQLLLMVSCPRNRFEPSSIFQPTTFVDDIKMILSEMHTVFRIIDILKLNKKIGL